MYRAHPFFTRLHYRYFCGNCNRTNYAPAFCAIQRCCAKHFCGIVIAIGMERRRNANAPRTREIGGLAAGSHRLTMKANVSHYAFKRISLRPLRLRKKGQVFFVHTITGRYKRLMVDMFQIQFKKQFFLCGFRSAIAGAIKTSAQVWPAFLAFMLAASACVAAPLSWEECSLEVARNNPELRAAHENVLQAQAQYRARWGVFLPSIQAGAGYDWAGRDNETTESGSARASAGQNLFSGFRDSARIKGAAAAVDAAQCRLQRSMADISQELAQAFAALLYAQEWVVLSAQINERRKENLRLVDLRFQEGREHKGAMLRSQAFARQSDFESAKAGRDMRVARENLAKTMGWFAPASMVVTGDWKFLQTAPRADNLDELVEKTPEYRLAIADRRQAQANLAVARSDEYPSLDISGSLSRSGQGWPPDQEQWGVGLSLSWALFRGGQTWNAISAAQAAARAAEADVRAVALSVRASFEQALSTLEDADENVEVQEQFLVAAEVRAEIARSQYSNGLLSFQDWDTIENDLMEKQKAVLQSRRAALLARAAVLRVQGISAIQ